MHRLLLMFLGVFLGLALAEGILRAVLPLLPVPADSLYISHPQADYLHRPSPPGTYDDDPDRYINSLGFRDREHSSTKPHGTIRILGIGDSFVFGAVPPSENFLTIAAAGLNEQLREDTVAAEMVLMGVCVYSPKQELAVLKAIGLALDPDMVILNFFVGNDVTDIRLRGKVVAGRRYFLGSPRPWLSLLRQSQLFLLAEKVWLSRIRAKLARWRVPRSAVDSRRAAAPGSLPVPEILGRQYLRIQQKRLPVYARSMPNSIHESWEEIERCLVEFDTTCREAGIPWLLHVIPSEIQVDPQTRADVLRGLGLSPTAYGFDAPQLRLRAFADTHGISILDPLPELRARSHRGARLYIPNDTHWNSAGNRHAGEILGRFLLEHFATSRPPSRPTEPATDRESPSPQAPD